MEKEQVLDTIQSEQLTYQDAQLQRDILASELQTLFSSTATGGEIVAATEASVSLYFVHSNNAGETSEYRRLCDRLIRLLHPRLWLITEEKAAQTSSEKISISRTDLPHIVFVEKESWKTGKIGSWRKEKLLEKDWVYEDKNKQSDWHL